MKEKSKIIIYISFIVMALLGLFYELHICGDKSKKDIIAYHKESKLNYITNLKDNKYYNNSYLKEDYNFVASLINNFSLDYNYVYTLSEDIDYILNYDVYAILEIYDSDNKDKPIEKNTYEIIPKTTESGSGKLIKVDLLNQIIDYEYYSKIIQNWKKEVSPDAKLTIYFDVNWTGNTKDLVKTINDDQTTQLNIPLSQKTISISKPADIIEDDNIIKHEIMTKGMVISIISTIVLIGSLFLRLILLIMEYNDNKDKYEVEINRLLREYDRAITEAKGSFKKSSKENNIEVSSFLELMDVHDNLNIPIIYYKNNEKSSTFIVRNDKTVYYYNLTKSDK